MADNTHRDILHSGITVWNDWRESHPSEIPDLRWAHLNGSNLSGANLSGADLSGVSCRGSNLSGADLSGANVKGAKFLEANFRRATLKGAYLGEASFRDADLSRASLNCAYLGGAILNESNLSRADLSGADLGGAELAGTLFVSTDLSETIGLDSCKHGGPSTIDHRTIERSGMLPDLFLRGCGWPDTLIDYYPSLLGQAISFYSCFISYSHADRKFARRLHDQLQVLGIRCWLDEHQLLPGDDIYEQVDLGIRLWDKILLCCSESSLKSWWVDSEIDRTFEKERQLMKDRGKKVLALIPLDLDGFVFDDQWESGKSRDVRSRLAANFTGWEKDNDRFESAFEMVVKALKSEDAGREKPPEQKL